MADEARAMLDALMGGDRNAPIPQGTSIQRGGSFVPTKRKKSCYDPDVDPLYCAWGIDVYELFVNTKSDIGSNPKLVSEDARMEFMQLPKHEQERLGYHAMLFYKLQDLVRMCDRTVSRSKEKLHQERRKGAAVDYVTHVDERAVEQLCVSQIEMEKLVAEILEKNKELERVMQQEKDEQQKRKKHKIEEEKEASNEEQEPKVVDTNGAETEPPKDATRVGDDNIDNNNEDNAITTELLLKRQRLLFEIARLMQQYAPLQQAVESLRADLEFVRSDITSDKTVCEVSGNFMSARDADERIAAHYAGKQYVGWKLVRDKWKKMQLEYGRYGPPVGDRGPPPPRGGGDGRGGGRGGGDRYNRGRRSPSPPRWDRGGGGGGGVGNRGYDGRGGGGGYGGGGDWMRGGRRDRGRGHWRR